GNVVADVPGGSGPRVLVAAHLDTVFGADVAVSVRRDGGRLCAPGIGDNSASLAVLTTFAERLAGDEGALRPRLTLAATVGEEGVGDLRGARRLVADHADAADCFVAVDGHLGTVVAQAVGSRRLVARFRGPGGHSWGDYPAASAVHAAGGAIHALAGLSVPTEPRTSLNVGQVWGGTSVNAIAQEAGFNLDLRSLDGDVLEDLERRARGAIGAAARRAGCEVELEPIGDRPAAFVDNHALVACALRALEAVGEKGSVVASSTDANAAMARGLPAIAFGVYRGGDAHRTSEWLDPASLALGYRAFEHLLACLAESRG
ncbi:MAG TPA: M20/M25/M40 family metallo-hydrolase, partial [Trueperaceae bacterium]|nr:M20/M25/M40 family metallo-hydrolase [Trueperaceae bacterium]